MKGALLELAARGEEDILLIGNPEFSYFKSVHKRHTNFSRFESQLIFQGQPDFGKKVTCIIDKRGDLLTNLMLEIRLPATGNNLVSWINGVGNYIIKQIYFRIGGEIIAQMNGEYIDTFYKYYLEAGHYGNYTSMVKRVSGYQKNSQPGQLTLYVLLPLWFTKELSQALPLISLGYHDITIDVEFRDLIDCIYNGNDKSTLSGFDLHIDYAYLWADYIYLDKWERQMFIEREEINYLIEQVQENVFSVQNAETNKNYELVFNMPVKELIWLYRSQYYENINRWDYYQAYDIVTGLDKSPLEFAGLQFNGLDRSSKRDADYYRLVQPVLRHNSSNNDYIYFYCFANKADILQPSGTANFSQIDDARLILQFYSYITTGYVHVWAVNYNFLKIKKGMAGILYSS